MSAYDVPYSRTQPVTDQQSEVLGLEQAGQPRLDPAAIAVRQFRITCPHVDDVRTQSNASERVEALRLDASRVPRIRHAENRIDFWVNKVVVGRWRSKSGACLRTSSRLRGFSSRPGASLLNCADRRCLRISTAGADSSPTRD